MGTYVVKLPDVGEGIAEAELVEWHVAVGDVIAEDQPIADVMTDKATVELPSPVGGKIAKLGAEAGDVVAIGSDLVWIETDGAAAPDDPVDEPVSTPAETAEPEQAEPASEPPPIEPDGDLAGTTGDFAATTRCYSLGRARRATPRRRPRHRARHRGRLGA